MNKFQSMLMAVKTAKKTILLAWALPPFVIIAWGFSWFLIKRDVSLELTLVLLSTPLLLAPLTALIVNLFVPIAINWRLARKYAIPSFIAYSLYAAMFLIIDWSISHISLDDEGFIAPFLEFLCAYIPISCFVFLEVTGSSNLGAHLHAIRKTQGSISSSDLIKVWGQDPVIKNLLAWVLPVLGGLAMIFWLFARFLAESDPPSNFARMRVFGYGPACISVSFVFGALAGFIIYRAWKAKSAIWAFILVFLGVVLWVVIAHEISDAIYRLAWW